MAESLNFGYSRNPDGAYAHAFSGTVLFNTVHSIATSAVSLYADNIFVTQGGNINLVGASSINFTSGAQGDGLIMDYNTNFGTPFNVRKTGDAGYRFIMTMFGTLEYSDGTDDVRDAVFYRLGAGKLGVGSATTPTSFTAYSGLISDTLTGLTAGVDMILKPTSTANFKIQTGGTTDALVIDVNQDATFYGQLDISNSLFVNTDTLAVIDSTNRVGINILSPSYTLDIQLDQATSATEEFVRIRSNNASSSTINSSHGILFNTRDSVNERGASIQVVPQAGFGQNNNVVIKNGNTTQNFNLMELKYDGNNIKFGSNIIFFDDVGNCIGHQNLSNVAANAGLRFTSLGANILNASSGQIIYFRINNSSTNQMYYDGNTFYLTGTLDLNVAGDVDVTGNATFNNDIIIAGSGATSYASDIKKETDYRRLRIMGGTSTASGRLILEGINFTGSGTGTTNAGGDAILGAGTTAPDAYVRLQTGSFIDGLLVDYNQNVSIPNGNLSVNGQFYYTSAAIDFTIAIDWDNGNIQTDTIDATAGVTIVTPSNANIGEYSLIINCIGTGSVTWFSGIKWKDATTLSTITNAKKYLVKFTYDGIEYLGRWYECS